MNVWSLRAFIVAAVVVGAASCSQSDALVVQRVLIDVDPTAASLVDREKVRASVADVLAHSRGVVVDEARSDGAVMRVRVESFTRAAATPADAGAEGAAVASLTLALDVTINGRPSLRGHSVASAHGINDPHVLVEQAVRDALTQTLQTRDADKLDSKVLLSWLTDPKTSTEQKKRAMLSLGSRRDRTATATLVAVLQSGDEALAATALQGLTLMGDEDAVDAIVAFSDRQPSLLRKLCIDAVRASGSKRGLPWLFTLSTGSPDSDVQQHAREALDAVAGSLAARPGATEATRGG